MRIGSAVLTSAVVVVVCGAIVLRNQAGKTSAADSDSTTWGAMDPAWSPDGQKLAFSLFGGIWEVSAGGGEARQVTNSSGYHAHPAWSPSGDKIAFIRGSEPGGRIPNVSGRLVVADVATGREREFDTKNPVTGTIAWSPDGRKIACPLQAGAAGALLHEMDAATGAVEQIQFGAGASPWADVTWSPRRNEIFFAARRGPAPQVWSITPGGPPIAIQMPLTRYRPEDIVMLDRLSATPDGSAVVYSAVVVNGKGDYELYRVPREGGTPVAITNTARDEFSPAISPDGRRIAHVSNQLGNVDLFTMPVSGGEKRHVRITGLKFRGGSGKVRVRVRDELGNPTRVRLYVRASDGKAYCPPGSPIFFYQLDPGRGREGFFVASGDDTLPVPAGRLELVALKGVEYEIATSTVEVAGGDTAEVTLDMKRWTNWGQRGWHTGENHFHANYNGSYYQRPPQSMAWIEAEDLNAATMMVANAAGAFIHDKEFFLGRPDPLSGERYVLYWGQEYRNSYPLGHMAFVNIKAQVPPSYTSVPGSDSPYDFPLNTMAALEAKKQGGLVTYVHPMNNVRDVFDTSLGAKEIPVGAALGAVDSVDILPGAEFSYELWYRLLNAGFRIAAGAGTDVFTNWRGINSIPGGARQYVEVGSAMNWDRWVARYREGRNFVTNGPLLTFNVNGQPLGAVIRVPAGTSYPAKLTAEVTARVPLESVEFVQNGKVIESREVPGGARNFRLEKDVTVTEGCWLAVRVKGVASRGIATGGNVPRAHSSPVYVEVGGAPALVKEDVELMIRWVDRLWALLEERDNFGPGDNRKRAQAMISQARQHFEKKLAQAR